MKQKNLVSLILTAALLVLPLGGCGKPASAPAAKGRIIDLGALAQQRESVVSVPLAPFAPEAYKPKVPGYTVAPDLSNVENIEMFKDLTPDQRKMLATQGFVAAPTDQEQMFYLYEFNDYRWIPNFITTDVMLQLHHVFYDYTLRNLEKSKLFKECRTLSQGMLTASIETYQAVPAGPLKQAALKNIAYYAVPNQLLGLKLPRNTPKEAIILANTEIRSIKAHVRVVQNADDSDQDPMVAPGDKLVKSSIVPNKIDYTQFIPRGHYTRTTAFRQYFQAMMWYGLVELPFSYREGGKIKPAPEPTMMAMLSTVQLCEDPALFKAWNNIYEPTRMMVGPSDDITPQQYLGLMRKVYGDRIPLGTLADAKNLKLMAIEGEKLPKPRIAVKMAGGAAGHSFKLMGQRFIADSRVLQEVSDFKRRPMPKGLDVMYALGSDRAYDLLTKHYKEDQKAAGFPYLKKLLQMRAEFDRTKASIWRSNLYYGWLWTLKAILMPRGDGFPQFMANQSWQDKSLNTALASWTELRHDTILYGKQSGAECGGAGEEPPPPPKGYVEPNVEFYERMLWLNQNTRENLKARGLLTQDQENKFKQIEEMYRLLLRVSLKELANQPISAEDNDAIKVFGSSLETLQTAVASDNKAYHWYDLVTETDRNMALVADVHTSYNSVLEEAVGSPYELLVVVPIEGKLYLNRGVCFSYYEFTWPSSDRLTDEKWQQMLQKKENPAPPSWIRSFVSKLQLPALTELTEYESGC
ncbi:MAG: DUF3160 domain-containing protein [Solirubrobacterales bacterium]